MKNGTLIAIDVGNTAISLGIFTDGKLILKKSIPTKECEKEFGKELRRLLRCARNDRVGRDDRHSRAISTTAGRVNSATTTTSRASSATTIPCDDRRCIVGSVVPGVDKIIKKDLRMAGIRFRFVKPGNCGVPILCKEPEKVGVDRLLNALATNKIYKKSAIVVDCGTATTFDVVSPKGEYLGGVISPGLEIGADALAQRCAKLFKVKLAFPRSVIGKNTREAMLSGIIFGHIAMLEGVIERLKKELKFKPIIIGTGGFINLISRGTGIFNFIDPDLTLKGLAIVAMDKKSPLFPLPDASIRDPVLTSRDC